MPNRFSEIAPQHGERSIIAPFGGREAIIKYANIMKTGGTIQRNGAGTIAFSGADQIRVLLSEPESHTTWLITYTAGGRALLDFDDDFCILLFPEANINTVRRSFDTSDLYDAALHEMEILKTVGVPIDTQRQLKEILAVAIQ